MDEERILKRLEQLKERMPEGTTVEGLLERAKEREAQMGDGGERKQIGVHMDIALWWKFKEQAAKEHMSAGQLLEKLVREYLDKQKE